MDLLQLAIQLMQLALHHDHVQSPRLTLQLRQALAKLRDGNATVAILKDTRDS